MENMMRAVVYQEKGRFALEERPAPEILDPGDAVVRVTLASICSSASSKAGVSRHRRRHRPLYFSSR